MKLSKIVLIAFALCQVACGDDEATESGSELQTSVEFELTGSEGYALTSAAVFIEPCLFDAEGQSEVLVLTPWEIDCDGPKIGQAPDNWKAVTITLEDGCGYDPALKTAEHSVERYEEGDVEESSYSHGHTHDFRLNELERTDDENGAEMISLEVDIFERHQAQGGEVIGTLKAAHVRHCGLKANEPGSDWWQPSDDR